MAMRIGVVGNHQVRGLADALRALLGEAEVIEFETTPSLARPASLRAAEAGLAECEMVVAHELPARWGRLSAAGLQLHAGRVVMLPVVEFAGFHPDCVTISAAGRPMAGPTGVLHSRLALIAYLAGASVGQAVSLYNRLAFARLGYFKAYAAHGAALTAKLQRFDMDQAFSADAWKQGGCFMHAPDRPRIAVLLDLARFACGWLGLEASPAVQAGQVRDRLAEGETFPLFGDLAASLGLAPETLFRDARRQGTRRTMGLREFVAQSFRTFEEADIDVLRAADGVAEGLEKLGMRMRPPPRRAGNLQPAMALMTYHGTLLRQPGPGGVVRHLPLKFPLSEWPPLRLEFADPKRLHGFDSDLLGGVKIVPGPGPGLLALSRRGRLFCPERDSDIAAFSREEMGAWEGFWPIGDDDLKTLSVLCATDWRIAATGEFVPRVMVRLANAFGLHFGRWKLDLRSDMPWLEAAGGPPRARIRLDGEAMLVVSDAPRNDVAASQNVSVAPLAPGQKRVVTGAPTLMCLPMVGCMADRRWLFDAYVGARPVPAGRFVHGAVLLRPADARLRFQPDGSVGPAADDDVGETVNGPAVLAMPLGLTVRAGWAEAALRLFALAPYLPPGARLLLPPGRVPETILAAWQALGPVPELLEAPGSVCIMQDMTWIGQDSAAQLPAEILLAFRKRADVVPPNGQNSPRIFVHGLGVPADAATIAAMAARGLVAVNLASLAPLEQLAAFRGAKWVVGASGPDLAGLVFCAAGTRVIELSPAARFVPAAWMIAAKLGLNFAILPGEALDLDRFDALMEMLGNRE